MSFAEIAEKRLLRSVASRLGELTWDVSADGYQRLRVPSTAEVDPLLRLLLRRGLDPALSTLLLDRFESRPVERALIAWDIAADSLLGPDDAALEARVRSHLAPLKEIGTSASVAVPRDRVTDLIASVGALGDRPLADGSSSLPSLASVAALAASDTDGIAAALAFAERAALAHLPSLALAYAQILWAQHAVPAALDRILELVLDHERFDSMPVMSDEDDRSVQRQAYFGVRVALARLDTDGAMKILERLSAHPAVAASSDPALSIAKLELELLSDKPIEYGTIERIEALAPNLSTWRYASCVASEIRIHQSPESSVAWLENFLTSFGNALRVWAQAGLRPEGRAELLALASREVRYQSWDPEAWRAFMVFLDDGTPIEVELQARSAAQLAAALA